ncbi:SDR family NAD(P)-dependent oxidoreductase [Streptomyces sp. XH2]|uniref:SDR family NAD(P)-dependent oxidoreductase n=1 Tax=Streptomyces sp. XH2 TaxID=3412483 RepID=UPI003C7DCCB3
MNNGTGVPGHDQDIAVVGLSLRLPGSRTPDEFWDHLARGRSLITEVPEHRRRQHRSGHPSSESDTTGSVWGGFVDDADCFDADFFRITPREARSMDLQQRIALELSWHALEDAGYRADRMAGSRTGVFMGACQADYAELFEQEAEGAGACDPAGAALADRVARHFGFRGPGAAGDTASAGSLVAVEQAVRALRSGDCDHALAGGVNLSWSPRHFVAFAKAGMASPGGRYRAFDANANGYVRGEGGGVLLLKRAADARRDGDAVHALIKGIGSDQGERTSSLTGTDPAAQAELITAVYRRAGIAPETVTYVETHGPGAPVGDPIEIRGLVQAFADLHENRPGTVASRPGTVAGRPDRVVGRPGTVPGRLGTAARSGTVAVRPGTAAGRPASAVGRPGTAVSRPGTGKGRPATARGHRCGVGSVKTSTGHLEGAAGVVGMLKVILAMRHRKLPATVGFEKLDPHIKLDGSPLYIVDRLTDWTAGPGTGPAAPLRAGVSSFGCAGTNSHVLLESGDPCAPAGEAPAGMVGSEQWLPVSAMDEDRLRATCAGLARWARTRIEHADAPALADVARTLREGRVPMCERVVFRASDLAEWAAQLESVAEGEQSPAGCFRGRTGADIFGAESPDGPGADSLAALAVRRLELGYHDEFAAAWVRGIPVDWAQWPEHGRRVHLPGYAFARTPHRFLPTVRPESGGAPPLSAPAAEPAPLGTGRRDADGWTFPLHFDAAQGFVRDHLINGARLVPGVIALELATAAARQQAVAGPHAGRTPRVRDAVWIRPLPVADQGLAPRLRLTPAGSGYDYAVTDVNGTPYATGRVEYAEHAEAPPRATDPGTLRDRFPERIDVAGGYAALLGHGIEHGPALCALHSLHGGPDGVLAGLKLPAGAPADMVLQPAILGSALLATLALGTGDDGEGGWLSQAPPPVPFTLDCLETHAATTREMWAWLRPAAGGRPGTDIDLLDESGRLCVRFTGYTTRKLPDIPAQGPYPAAGEELMEVTGVWTEAPAPAPGATPRDVTVLNAFLDQDLVAASAARLGADVLHLDVPAGAPDAVAMKAAFAACYPHVQRLLGQGRHALVVAPGAPDSPVHAPLAALLRTAHQENPSFTGGLVLLDGHDPRDPAAFERIVRAEAGTGDGGGTAGGVTEIAYDRDGRRLRRTTVELPPAATGESLLRDGGVYWITGGAGGLGLLVAERLCERHHATVVVGGRPAHSPAVDALQARLPHGEVTYRCTDVTDADAVRAVVTDIHLQYGRLDGVFHAVDVFDDGYLARTPFASTAAVLAPTVDGAAHIDAATYGHGLDFLLLFGSATGAFGNVAQAGHAAAGAFLDAFAARRQAAGSVTRAVDWSLWADGGTRLDDAALAHLRRRTGIVPLPTETGLTAIERALRSDGPVRRVVLYGEKPKLRAYAGLDPAGRPALPAPWKSAAAPAAALGDLELRSRTQGFRRTLRAA